MSKRLCSRPMANATLLEFPCGAVLIDAGAQDEEKVEELVRFLNEFFARRQDLGRTIKSTEELLSAMTRQNAVISCGRWDFGRPATCWPNSSNLTLPSPAA